MNFQKFQPKWKIVKHYARAKQWVSLKKLFSLTIYARNNIFRKRIPNMRFWMTYILIQISFFGGTGLGCFSQCFLKIFVVGQPWWPTLSLSLPIIRKLPMALYNFKDTLTRHYFLKNYDADDCKKCRRSGRFQSSWLQNGKCFWSCLLPCKQIRN